MSPDAYGYEFIQVEISAGVAFATIDNPPINLISLALFGELAGLADAIAQDDRVRVLVLRSANPDFFLAHFDVEAILGFPTQGEAVRSPDNAYHQMCERYRLMDTITVAQIEGRVGGGGSELVQAFDMRFGVLGQTVINQMEVPVGILPGGGGTQRLPRMLGRGRALEVILAAEDLDAETAERWGFLNRALPPGEIGDFVDRLARRMAGHPPQALKLAKQAVNAADLPLAEGLEEEAFLFQQLLRTEDAPLAMRRFLEAGGQTREGELRVAELDLRLRPDAKA
jgi:enoyl-CoA hydratase/carnithine racemase